MQSYSVYVNGTELTDAYVSVPVDQTKETQNISVLVTSGRYRTEYTLIVQRGEGKKVTVTLADGNMDIVMKTETERSYSRAEKLGTNTSIRW